MQKWLLSLLVLLLLAACSGGSDPVAPQAAEEPQAAEGSQAIAVTVYESPT